VAEVLKGGAEKYGPDNWRRIPVAEHLNHAMTHILAYFAGDTQDHHLEHAACRMMMALEMKRTMQEPTAPAHSPPKNSTASLFANAAMEMLTFFEDAGQWSFSTFGPSSFKGPRGALRHLRKEAKEAFEEKDPEKQKVEIIDCLFLVFDAARRAGMSFADICQTAQAKLIVNKLREWPDWRGTDPDEPIEHVRTLEDKS
jgi:hypothetical protein